MLKRKVIVDGIISLTDARYFAAAGVDYLLFDLSLNSIDDIVEIQDWIEGPEILLSFGKEQINQIEEALLKISPMGVSGIDSIADELLSNYPSFQQFEYSKTDESKQIDIDNHLFSSHFDIEEISDSGIILTVFGEDEIGLKQFDVFDEILEQLEES